MSFICVSQYDSNYFHLRYLFYLSNLMSSSLNFSLFLPKYECGTSYHIYNIKIDTMFIDFKSRMKVIDRTNEILKRKI